MAGDLNGSARSSFVFETSTPADVVQADRYDAWLPDSTARSNYAMEDAGDLCLILRMINLRELRELQV